MSDHKHTHQMILNPIISYDVLKSQKLQQEIPKIKGNKKERNPLYYFKKNFFPSQITLKNQDLEP